MVRVLRKRVGDVVWATDGMGNKLKVELIEAGKKRVEGKILKKDFVSPGPEYLLATGAVRQRERMEFAVEKAVELGATRIIIFHSDYSGRQEIRPARIRKTILSAMKQSRRYHLPAWEEYRSFDDVLTKYAGDCDFWMAHPAADSATDPTEDPATYPTTNPTEDSATDSATDSAADPGMDSAAHLATDPATDSTADPTADPATNPVTEPEPGKEKDSIESTEAQSRRITPESGPVRRDLRRMLLAVGPEGGFSQREVELAERAGVRLVDLGPGRLRTETAVCALMSLAILNTNQIPASGG